MKSLARRVEDALMTVKDMLPRRMTAGESLAAATLRADLAAIGREAHSTGQTTFWAKTCQDLIECAKEDPRDFMRWPPIAGTMVHRTTPGSIAAYRDLRGSPDWPAWKVALRHPNMGNGPPFLPAPWTSAISVQHAAHLMHYRRIAGADFTDADTILDMGAGYASMCRLTKARGYPGDYVIFDQPPVLALQRYFLGQHGIEATFDELGSGRVALCRDLDLVRSMARARTSLISTWAMSEMPIEVRDRIEPILQTAGKVLLAYQIEFNGIDNRAYFLGLAERMGAVHHVEVPRYPGNFYLFR